jgi:hypothetical protein
MTGVMPGVRVVEAAERTPVPAGSALLSDPDIGKDHPL